MRCHDSTVEAAAGSDKRQRLWRAGRWERDAHRDVEPVQRIRGVPVRCRGGGVCPETGKAAIVVGGEIPDRRAILAVVVIVIVALLVPMAVCVVGPLVMARIAAVAVVVVKGMRVTVSSPSLGDE